MDVTIMEHGSPAVNPRPKECLTCGGAAPFPANYCATCAPPVVAPAKLAPLPEESPALCVARLGTQARMNGSHATPCGHGRLQWRVTSQRAHGHPHLVTLSEGTYTCSCPATRLCAHIALVRTTITDCPACDGPLTVFAPPRGCGALYCPACGARADLDPDETEGLWCYAHGMGGNIRLLISAVLAPVSPICEAI